MPFTVIGDLWILLFRMWNISVRDSTHMDPSENPLEIPEVLDQILSFLDAQKDLHACALVHPSWVYTSQSLLFSSITIPPALLSSIASQHPHLIGFIQTLKIIVQSEEIQGFSLPSTRFPQLSTLTLTMVSLPMMHYSAIQQLLRTPSLVSGTIRFNLGEAKDFAQIWDGCSASIKHVAYGLNLFSDELSPGESYPAYVGNRPLRLESFWTADSVENTLGWLHDPGCPFNLAHLKAFKFYRIDYESFAGILAGSFQSIEFLSFNMRCMFSLSDVPNIFPFRRVTQVDVDLDKEGKVDANFHLEQLILPETRPRIQAIRFHAPRGYTHSYTITDLRNLDRSISEVCDDFENLKTVEIVMDLKASEKRRRRAVEEELQQRHPKIKFACVSQPEPWYRRMIV
ncbi:hypothetical protein FB45DRAFT_1079065 [Roridomyces roridus]|uniref:F-box domain-containing protein n=1 Tax=Roridomyces roridus TaxID=1738132 RepID=A0AAD7CL30_9AGAR|nr:hypothetical protein FB45DRAFT_1079065 [Roridomyces roridus]